MIQTLCNALRVTIPELMDGEGAAKNRVGDWLLAVLALLLGGVSCAAWRLQKRLGWITLEKDQMDSL